jgi:hypothetical protein
MILMNAALGTAALGLLALPRLRAAYRGFRAYRGSHIVTCPETGAPAALQLSLFRVTLAAAFGRSWIVPRACSSRSKCAACANACDAAIAAARGADAPRVLILRWAAGRVCARCRLPLATHPAPGFEPELLRQDGSSVSWRDVPPETLPAHLETDEPLCWYCHAVSNLRVARGSTG